MRERRKTYSRRIEAVQRIQQAAGGLDERIGELQQQQTALTATEQELVRLTSQWDEAEPGDAPTSEVMAVSAAGSDADA